jgi:xylulokinase
MGLHLGIDVGSQSLKAVLLDERLGLLGSGRRHYPVQFPKPGWAEQDPAVWEAALAPAIAEALAAAGRRPADVGALGLAGQLDGCIAVGAEGRPLHPCLIWMDRRAERSLDRVRARIAPETVRARTGANLDGGHMAPKIRWLLDEAPAARAAVLFHQPVSYLVERLTGERVIDHGLASTSLVYDLATGDWADDLLAAFDIERRRLAPLGRSEAMAGRLHAAGARACGLPVGLPVAVGTGDDFSTPLGGGVMRRGVVANVLGTAEVVGALHDRPAIDPTALTETHRYVGAGFYYVENPGWVSGGAVEWLRATLGLPDFAAFDRLAASAPAGSDELVFLPALTGAMTPEWVAGARGCFYGLTPAHGPGHLARAVLEGNAFGLMDVVLALDAMGVATDRLRALGGGARSDLWLQIRADLTGRPVERAPMDDSSAVGAALLAAVAGGSLPDLATAAAGLEGGGAAIEPDRRNAAAYAEAHHRYRRLFAALKPMFA